MLTAKEARKLAGKDGIEDVVKRILKKIEEVAKKHRTVLDTSEDYFEDMNVWGYNGGERIKACRILTKLGYVVEGNWSSDVETIFLGTIVEW